MKTNKGLTALIVSLIIFAAIGIYGAFFLPSGDELLYGILFLYLLFPLVCVISGLFVGRYTDKMRFLYPIITAISFIIITTAVFSFDLSLLIVYLAVIPTVIGVALGALVKRKSIA